MRAARNACGEQCPVIALQPKHASLWVVGVSPAALGKLGLSYLEQLTFDHRSDMSSEKAYVIFIAM